MAILKELEDEYVKEGLFESNDMGFSYPLGFPILDQQLGFIQRIECKDGQTREQVRLGVPAGKITQFIGPSSSGKTAAAIQAAWNIVEDYGEDAIVLHFDAENATEPQRILDLTGMSVDEFTNRYKILSDDKMTYNRSLEVITALCKKKEESKCFYETGCYDIHGNPITHYVPTAIIIDSQVRIVSDDIMNNTTEIGGGTEAGREAIARGKWYRSLITLCGKYNLNIIVVNHLGNEMQIAGSPKAKQLTFIPTGKNVPGGDKVVYYTSTFILFAPINSKDGIKKEEEHGYNGVPIRATVCKSRTGPGGYSAVLEFIQEAGFDPRLTLLNLAKEQGLIKGRNPGCYFESNPDVKFDTRIFMKEMADKPEIVKELFRLCKPILKGMVRLPAESDDFLRGSDSKKNARSMLREMF